MIHEYFWDFCYFLGALLLASNLWMYLRVLRPLQRLVTSAQELGAGNFSSIEDDCGGIPEIRTLRRSMASMVKHVRRAQQQSVKYADNLTEVQENERLRIARELHDDTIQSLIAISQSIDMARTWVETMPEKALHMLNTARTQAVDTVSSLRGLIEDLRPPALEELGLVAALEMQTEKCGFPVQMTVEGQARRLNEQQELALFRSTQEALNNARRHSAASCVTLRLSYQPDGMQIAISDNGKGFQPPAMTDLADNAHYGLLGIQERIQQLGGTFTLGSNPGRGTYLLLDIPFEPAPQPDNTVRDPVCSAMIKPQQAYASTVYNSERYYFCCPICQGAFQKEPERYVYQHAAARHHSEAVEAM